MSWPGIRWDLAFVLGWVGWIVFFVGYELYAVLGGNPRTPPLTDVTVRYVPWWVLMPFLLWLLLHFGYHYALHSRVFAKIFGA